MHYLVYVLNHSLFCVLVGLQAFTVLPCNTDCRFFKARPTEGFTLNHFQMGRKDNINRRITSVNWNSQMNKSLQPRSVGLWDKANMPMFSKYNVFTIFTILVWCVSMQGRLFVLHVFSHKTKLWPDDGVRWKVRESKLLLLVLRRMSISELWFMAIHPRAVEALHLKPQMSASWWY